jgi:hypothetical protein
MHHRYPIRTLAGGANSGGRGVLSLLQLDDTGLGHVYNPEECVTTLPTTSHQLARPASESGREKKNLPDDKKNTSRTRARKAQTCDVSSTSSVPTFSPALVCVSASGTAYQLVRVHSLMVGSLVVRELCPAAMVFLVWLLGCGCVTLRPTGSAGVVNIRTSQAPYGVSDCMDLHLSFKCGVDQ